MNSHTRVVRKQYSNDARSDERTVTSEAIEGLFPDLTGDEFMSLLHAKMEAVDISALRKENPDIIGNSGRGLRSAPRYGVHLKVLLVSNSQIFKTKTHNVSLSGLLLEDLIPEKLMRGTVDVILVNESNSGKDRYLVFRGHAVGAPLRTKRLAFDFVKTSSHKELSEMLFDLTPLCG